MGLRVAGVAYATSRATTIRSSPISDLLEDRDEIHVSKRVLVSCYGRRGTEGKKTVFAWIQCTGEVGEFSERIHLAKSLVGGN